MRPRWDEAWQGTLKEFGKRLANVLENLFKLSLSIALNLPRPRNIPSLLLTLRLIEMLMLLAFCCLLALLLFLYTLSFSLYYICMFIFWQFFILYTGEEIENFH